MEKDMKVEQAVAVCECGTCADCLDNAEHTRQMLEGEKPPEVIDLLIFNRISVIGEIYEVERVWGNFLTVKYKGIDASENRPAIHRHRLSKGNTYNIGGKKYRVMSSVASVWFRLKIVTHR